MRVSVDLAKCQSYGQCVFFAPEVFVLRDRETLEFDSSPATVDPVDLAKARAACPVQAITVGPAAGPVPSRPADGWRGGDRRC